ncbi:MAG: hypothetical protein WHS82_02880 [Candidatus Methanosuratincola sp.]
MKKISTMIAAVMLAVMLPLSAVAVMGASVLPTLYDSWQSGNAKDECYQANSSCAYAYKIDNWDFNASFNMSGAYTVYIYGNGTVSDVNDGTAISSTTITISNHNGTHFDWSIGPGYCVCTVIVKGGPSANVFNYDCATSDEGLYAPTNPANNKPYGISHVTFCFRESYSEAPCYYYETAYAKAENSECFIDHGFSRWGWTTQLPEYGTYDFELWAGAGQCDTSKGVLVGTVTITYDGSGLTWSVEMEDNAILENEHGDEEVHVYAGTTMFPMVKQGKVYRPTVAPGQYYIDLPNEEAPIWVIFHAVVGIETACPETTQCNYCE